MLTGKPNRLASEKSPYLLQHANNPVDWYPWGREAFDRAVREDKPVFLSIGYSTCHWCHVMERESFESPVIADVLNQSFISIKADREERPDIDGLYMHFVMAATGSGGWPLTVILTPDQKPFYGGTYFPPDDRYGRPGLKTLLLSIADAWKTRRDEVLVSASASAHFLSTPSGPSESAQPELTEKILSAALEDFVAQFDERYGGFGGAPKFPRSHSFSFLLGEALYQKNASARDVVETSLTQMLRGGLYDQLGGGFHRYSTDAQWRVPHFEKMLYDQALLVKTLVDAYRLTRNDRYARAARETLDYVLREMTHPLGGFYSAQDADSADPSQPSEKREGAFFVWTASEIRRILGDADAAIFCAYYGIEENGNALSDPHGEFGGKNVLYQAMETEEAARQFKLSAEALEKSLAHSREALFSERSRRPLPHLDDKILADWNGLMIGAFADAARALDEPNYLEAARQAAEFVEKRMIRQGRLYHRWRQTPGVSADREEPAIPAFLTDEIFLAWGYLSLYEAGFDVRWLTRACELAGDVLQRFFDSSAGGFFVSADDGEVLLARTKETYDGAVPSGNSVAACVLFRLWSLTGQEKYREAGDRLLKFLSPMLTSSPTSHPQALMALRLALGPTREVVIRGGWDDPAARALARETGFSFFPNQVTLFHQSGPGGADLETLAPFTAALKPVAGLATAAVCWGHACRAPVSDAAELKRILQEEAAGI